LDEVCYNPKLTAARLARAKSFADVFPEPAISMQRRGAQKSPTKVALSIRLSRDVVEAFRSDGPGWQSRMDDALRAAVRRKKAG
jgi:uncharacterized protein (DUF4415 family)